MSGQRLHMPCFEGRGHRWETRTPADRWWWDPRCTVCDKWRSELRHWHGLLCEYETGEYVPKCEFVLEREARLAISAARNEVRWAELQEASRRADARRKERQERWRQIAAEYESRQTARREAKHQRARLREGHATLTAIRRLLRGPGVRSSLDLVSAPAMTSRT